MLQGEDWKEDEEDLYSWSEYNDGAVDELMLEDSPRAQSTRTLEFVNDDIRPTTVSERRWTAFNFGCLWCALIVNVTSYLTSSSLVQGGLRWWEALVAVELGTVVILGPILLNGYAGAVYGLNFPVMARASFGIRGANFPALLRAAVACGWFGINVWLGGESVLAILELAMPRSMASLPEIFPASSGLTSGTFLGFLIFWAMNVAAILTHMEGVKRIISLKAVIIFLGAIGLLGWALEASGGYGAISRAEPAHHFKSPLERASYMATAVTSVCASWSTLSLNVPDFTRFARSPRDQALGQSLGMPIAMFVASLVSVTVTGATVLLYGEPIFDPVQVIQHFGSRAVRGVCMLLICLATLIANVAANVVGPANDFSHMAPQYISFRGGGVITSLIGIAICPWKILSSYQSFLYQWLLLYAAFLGPLAGIIITDFYVIRRQRLIVQDLFLSNGTYWYYRGFNLAAFGAFIIAVIPNLPGIIWNNTYEADELSGARKALTTLYTSWSWFVGFVLGALAYWGLMQLPGLLRRRRDKKRKKYLDGTETLETDNFDNVAYGHLATEQKKSKRGGGGGEDWWRSDDDGDDDDVERKVEGQL